MSASLTLQGILVSKEFGTIMDAEPLSSDDLTSRTLISNQRRRRISASKGEKAETAASLLRPREWARRTARAISVHVDRFSLWLRMHN